MKIRLNSLIVKIKRAYYDIKKYGYQKMEESYNDIYRIKDDDGNDFGFLFLSNSKYSKIEIFAYDEDGNKYKLTKWYLGPLGIPGLVERIIGKISGKIGKTDFMFPKYNHIFSNAHNELIFQEGSERGRSR